MILSTILCLSWKEKLDVKGKKHWGKYGNAAVSVAVQAVSFLACQEELWCEGALSPSQPRYLLPAPSPEVKSGAAAHFHFSWGLWAINKPGK